MTKYYCDRCGGEIERYSVFTLEITPPEIRTIEDASYSAELHICRDCIKDVDRFIRAGRTDCAWK